METLVQMDKENGDIGNLASSIRQDSSKLFSKKVRSLHKVKSFNAPRTQAHRKVLGNVNKTAESSKPFMTKKVHKGKICDQISEDVYPEIETLIPYNPLDTLQDFMPLFEDITIDLPPVCDL